jgi:ATP-binding cassette subfamily F protein 3
MEIRLIRAIAVARSFGEQVLFEPSDWFLGDRDRVGLVGPNGSGKSTWLKMLAGLEGADGGRIEMPKGQRVGYLPQFGFRTGGGTVREEARAAFSSVLALTDERERLELALEHPDIEATDASSLLRRHDHVEQEIRRLDGYEVDRRVDRVLRGLGFDTAGFDRPVPELSGGWQMRVALARLLLEEPEVLLLDEPTNHLDLEAREWLEGFLGEYAGSFVLVSHDRYFLDRTVTRITDIMNRRLHGYTGNYTRYLDEREARYAQALKAYERQQDEIRRIQVFIERFRAKNTKATQVQSRIKMLEKIPRLEPPQSPPRTIHFQFPQPGRTGRIVLELREVAKSYGELRVFRGVDLALERGQKVALVGPNGAGKSTLMRILAGAEPFDAGWRTEGVRVTLDHFAQDQADQLPSELSILEATMGRASSGFAPQVRSLLGAFLFSGDAVGKKIGVLSGGERNRLALAFMLMRPASVLLLDEPTNHLDMAAKDVLLEALRSFEGTVVFVSHDRYFLEGLAGRVLEVGGGMLRDHPGGYESYLWRKQQEEERAAVTARAEDERRRGEAVGNRGSAQANAAGTPGASTPGAGIPGGGTVSSSARRSRVTTRRVRALEERIAVLEERKGRLEALLARDDFYRDAEKSAFYLDEYRALGADLESALEEWAAAAAVLDEARGES